MSRDESEIQEAGPGIEVVRLPGLVPYAEGLRVLDERRAGVERGDAPNTLYLLQHPPTITLGRSTHREHLLRTPGQLAGLGIDVCDSNRGGDVTYHGPGQLIAYPVLDLRHWRTSIRWYLRALEEVLIRHLARYGLEAARLEGYTGVWVGDAKVAAIGIALHNWVTGHGVALNVAPDMRHFEVIVPCGIVDKPITSIERLLGRAPAMDQVMDDFTLEFLARFAQGA